MRINATFWREWLLPGLLLVHLITAIAICAFAYCLYDFTSILVAIGELEARIALDSGLYYLLVMTIFFWFSFISVVGKKRWAKKIVQHTGVVMLLWLFASLLSGYLVPIFLQSKLQDAGYIQTLDESDTSRLYLGESLIYVRDE